MTPFADKLYQSLSTSWVCPICWTELLLLLEDSSAVLWALASKSEMLLNLRLSRDTLILSDRSSLSSKNLVSHYQRFDHSYWSTEKYRCFKSRKRPRKDHVWCNTFFIFIVYSFLFASSDARILQALKQSVGRRWLNSSTFSDCQTSLTESWPLHEALFATLSVCRLDPMCSRERDTLIL